MSLKLILRTENSKAGIISKFLRFISFRADGPSPQHSVELFGVTNDGEFYKRYPPQNKKDSWLGSALKIGTSGWDNFQHLFFHPDGTLYGVWDGRLHKGPPPTITDLNWLNGATLIGFGGWERFPIPVLWSQWGFVWGNRGKALQGISPITLLIQLDCICHIGGRRWLECRQIPFLRSTRGSVWGPKRQA